MKKYGRLGVVLMLSLCVCMLVSTVVCAAKLKDVDKHWAKEYIEYGVEKGYISGYEDGTFLPDKTVTRAEFSKMINSAIKLTAVGTAQADFTDVSENEWYFNEVKKAENAGYITGYEDGSFRPSNTVTRQEAAVILSRIVLPTVERADINAFEDGGNIDVWATDAVTMIAAKGYIKGDENKNFNPKDALTRSQAAKLICEFIKNENVVNKNQNITSSEAEIVYSDIIFTDDIVIDIETAKDLSVIFKDCRVLGTVYIKTKGAEVDFENTKVKNLVVDADDVEISIDRASDVTTTTLKEAASLNGDGFKKVVLSGDDLSSGLVALDGSFADVEVQCDALVNSDVVKHLSVTKKVSLVLQSGTVNKLVAEKDAKGSTINLSKKTVVEDAQNKAAVSYVGSGTIENANNEVTGVEYDGVTVVKTTGKKGEGDSVGSSTDDDFFKDVDVSPAKGKTNQSVSVNVYLTFLEEVFDEDGKAIDGDYIEDNFELRRSSATGTKTAFTASIATSKKKITINPNANLSYSSTYYLVIPAGVLTYEDGSKNDEFVTYFKTAAAANEQDDDDDDDGVEIEFTPEKGKKAPADTEIEIVFSEKVYRSSSKKALDDTYCESTVFEIRKGSKSGDEVDFTAEVASTAKKVTLIPDGILEPDTKYYIILNKKLYDSDGDLIPSDSSYFTTDGGLAVTITPEDGAKNVSTTPEIVLSFSETVLNYNGRTLTDSDVEDGIVEIRLGSKKGEAISFSAEVATGGKKITLYPEELEVGKKYCVVLYEESLVGKDSDEENEEIVSYFTVATAAAPMITPSDGERSVGVDTEIYVSFSDILKTTGKVELADLAENEIDEFYEYINDKQVVTLRRKSATGTKVPCDYRITADGTTLILVPKSELSLNYEYYVVVKASTLYVGSTKKNTGATTSFSTNEALMPTFSVDDGDKNVDVDATFKITFDENVYNIEGDELSRNYIVEEVVSFFRESDGMPVEFGAKISGRTITITPTEDLLGGTEYVLSVNSGTVTNNDGEVNQSYNVTFRTESKIVKKITCDPDNNQKDVSVYIMPMVNFGSPIYKASTGGDITEIYAADYICLRKGKSTGEIIDAEVVFTEDFRVFTIIPYEELEYDTKYFVTVASGKFEYEDESKVPTKNFYFTTGSEEDEEFLVCDFCEEEHRTEDHECSKCGEYGHETEQWCNRCGTHQHDQTDHCSICGELDHDQSDHCGICGELDHDEDECPENESQNGDEGEGEGPMG